MRDRERIQTKASSIPTNAFNQAETGLFRKRPFAVQAETETDTDAHPLPDLQTQLERGARFNESLSRMKVYGNRPVIQPKIAVGPPGDRYEQEADRVADQVMNMKAPTANPQPVQRQQEEQAEESVQMQSLAASITPLVQREAMPEEKDEQVQAKAIQREALEEEETDEQVQAKAIQRQEASERERKAAGRELERRAGGKGEKDGSGQWGRDAKDRGLTDRANHYMWTRVALAAETWGLTNAARHMRHYLGNTGSPLTVNVDNMMRDVPDLATAYTEQQKLAMEAANKRIAQMGQITQTQKFQLTGERMSDVYCDQGTSADWFYAIGGFTYWYTAEVTVIPKKGGAPQVQMVFTLHVYDRYNWDQGKSVTIGGITVTDEQLGRLHRVGLAREYPINGTSSPHFTKWTYSPASVASPGNAPRGNDRDGTRSDPSRERGRHFDNLRGSPGSNR